MIKVVPFWQSNPIEYLVRTRFPMARFEDTLLPYPEAAGESNSGSTQRAAEEYRDELEELSLDDLMRRVASQREIDLEAARQKAEREEQTRPFNRPDTKADFDHWAKMSYWAIDEAVALSFGKRPNCISVKQMESLKWTSPFAKEYLEKREVAMRAKTMGQLWDSTSPAVFLAWAERMRFTVPVELVEAVKALGIQIADWKTHFDQQKKLTDRAQSEVAEERAAHVAAIQDHSKSLSKTREHQKELAEGYRGLLDRKDGLIALKDERIEWCEARIVELESAPVAHSEKPLGTRERESLLKLVIGMAIKGYSYDPKSGRTSTAKEIAGDLALIGLAMDEDTVRKYLGEARQLLPGDETEQGR